MLSICGMDCCDKCGKNKECGGCEKTGGHPFGGDCLAAEIITKNGKKAFDDFKSKLVDEINMLGIKNLRVTDLNLLNGFFINIEYRLKGGQTVKLLSDSDIYLGNQIEIPNSDRCYGVAADDKNILVCEYGFNGAEPEIIVYKKREY